MAVVTRAELRALARRRGELRDPFITDADLNAEIDLAHRRLRARLHVWDESLDLASQTVTVIAGTAGYALPADYEATVSVAVASTTSASGYVRLVSIDWRARHEAAAGAVVSPESTRYAIRGSQLVLWPTPTWAGSVLHDYLPVPAALTADSGAGGTIDLPAGAEEWIAYAAAIPCVAKAGHSVAEHKALLDSTEAALRAALSRRDRGSPRQIEPQGVDWRGRTVRCLR